MIAPAAVSALENVLENSRSRLLAISEHAASDVPAAGQWSKKEILGHLIDSASNNHQRFVRLRFEDGLILPAYQQNEWVRSQNYSGRAWSELVELWLAYNRHLAHVIRHADASAAAHIWKGPEGDANLQFLIEDYLHHLEHHLVQILTLPD